MFMRVNFMFVKINYVRFSTKTLGYGITPSQLSENI